MGTNAQEIARSINVTGLSDEAIRPVESLVLVLRDQRVENQESAQAPPDPISFEKGIEELLEGLPTINTLPDDFSRADIYGDHP
jgi:hypothetical protein